MHAGSARCSRRGTWVRVACIDALVPGICVSLAWQKNRFTRIIGSTYSEQGSKIGVFIFPATGKIELGNMMLILCTYKTTEISVLYTWNYTYFPVCRSNLHYSVSRVLKAVRMNHTKIRQKGTHAPKPKATLTRCKRSYLAEEHSSHPGPSSHPNIDRSFSQCISERSQPATPDRIPRFVRPRCRNGCSV